MVSSMNLKRCAARKPRNVTGAYAYWHGLWAEVGFAVLDQPVEFWRGVAEAAVWAQRMTDKGYATIDDALAAGETLP